MRKVIGVMLALAMLPACTTTYGVLEQAQDDARCVAFGREQGTQGHNDCMAWLYAQRQQETQQKNNALAAALVGAAVIGTVAVAASNPGPRYWCQRYYPYRCYYY
jgi:hypothetical protein